MEANYFSIIDSFRQFKVSETGFIIESFIRKDHLYMYLSDLIPVLNQEHGCNICNVLVINN